MMGTYRTAVSSWSSDPRLLMSRHGSSSFTQSLETSSAAPVDSRPNCAATTPEKMVRSTEIEACTAPANDMRTPDGIVRDKNEHVYGFWVGCLHRITNNLCVQKVLSTARNLPIPLNS